SPDSRRTHADEFKILSEIAALIREENAWLSGPAKLQQTAAAVQLPGRGADHGEVFVQVVDAPLDVFEHLGWDAVRRRPSVDRVEGRCRVAAVAVIGEREEVLRHPGNAQRLVEIARCILRVLSGGQDEAGREAVLMQARERGDRGLPDLPAAPGL